ncbi:MAG TPA: VWA domain-containing protein [Pyrinomonadaceae bacterium]|nr:VWA domain-containing protein [Pyrinomonadaceae bacterium]
MKDFRRRLAIPPRHIFVSVVMLVIVAVLLCGTRRSSAQPQDGRPRRTDQAAPAPSPTLAQVQTPSRTNPSQDPTPPPRRGAPTLGDAPPPPKLRPKPTPIPTPFEVDPGDILHINSQLVTLNIRVIDRGNRPIDNLSKESFHVFEDGVPQSVENFTKEEVPITYGLAVDTSLSLRSQIQSVIDAAKTIINSNRRGDETFIERFISSDKIEQVSPFTTNKDQLLEAIDNLYLEGGQTAVIDGVYLAAESVADYRKGDDSDRRRRALIVITDGEDRHSYYTEPQLMQRLREEDVQIFVIGFVSELEKEAGFIKKSPQAKAMALMNKFATETGGRAFFPQSLSELPEIANSIVRDMRTQYVLTYNPTNKERDGTYRAIRVSVDDGPQRDKRVALTRSGRVASRENTPARKTPATRTTNAARPLGNGAAKSP